MKRLVLIFFVLPICLFAQTDESDTLKLQARLSLSGIFQGGNVQTVIFRANSDLSYKLWEKWVFKTQNSFVYQEFGKQKADEDILSLNFLYFNPRKKIYPLLLGFVSTNFRRQIDVRTLLGGGVTFQLLKNDGNWLKIALSSEYEQTEFNNDTFNRAAYNGTQSIDTFRGTIWIKGKYHLFKRKLIVGHESYYQPSLERGDNYRWRVDLGLEIPLTKYLNFRTNFLHTFESIVIEGQRQEDSLLTFGFTVKNF
ncbi:MAG: DUF481 domain-containing protein [Phaeodactylibacter xiamenensis]|uniref:DUF481 domain-containing protein n=1 Tax=Phaeodactylibacter xiamenensis TaxID=1524460 RepID=A0A098S0J4_9BACT|nr:DUF481 domain-containing protein [Phaeodactylibacter xiamenensis]KGE85839.1 hypothetical protein IX84_24765 [Phaeodactylibacter xiamenensis]MCR9053243.1 DUF481 domain-containing protein [bacterium]